MERVIDTSAEWFCDGCICNDGEGCMKITVPDTRYDDEGKLAFCAGLTY